MIFFPAIDLKDGQCVRLLQGDMDRATVFGDDPAGQARAFAEAGCEWLHVVDLNGAFAARPVNGAAVDAILAAVLDHTRPRLTVHDSSTAAAPSRRARSVPIRR